MPEFRMNVKRLRAARLIAENDMSLEDVAEAVHISIETLYHWREETVFRAAVKDFASEIDRAALRVAIAKKSKRLLDYDDMARRMALLIEDREAAYSSDDSVIGGRSGLVVKTIKSIGQGRNQQIIETNEFDAALIREWRELRKQAATESGGIVERHEISAPDGQPLVIRDIVVDRTASGGQVLDEEDPEDMEEAE